MASVVPTATILSQNTPGSAGTTLGSVVLIQNPTVSGAVGKGTGWVVNPMHIVTNAHVVDGNDPARGLVVVFADGTQQLGTVVAIDTSKDLAAIQLRVPCPVSPLAIDVSPLAVGTQVATWGHPLGYSGPAPMLTMGFMSGFEGRGPNLKPWLVLNAAINGGNSGGPLFEWNQAKVRGVIFAKHAPIPAFLLAGIQALANNQSGVVFNATTPSGQQIQFVESQLVAELLAYFREMTQVVIGLAVSAEEVVTFLNAAGVKWTA